MITIKHIKIRVSGKIDPINPEQFFVINPILPLPRPESPKIDELFDTQL